MQREQLEGYISRLARNVSQSGTVGNATRSRLVANLMKEDRSQLQARPGSSAGARAGRSASERGRVQADVQAAVQHLAEMAPSKEAFLAKYGALQRALPAEAATFVSLLSKIARNPHINAEISEEGEGEGLGTSRRGADALPSADAERAAAASG